ncbi:hypothetical protein CF5_0131 [Staphylococcus phage CF5]|uniref:Uncharacterized protein n=1 Tax=Staphylococcus phage CF5 TaxID=3113739 RepID=A0AAX4J7J2_9CAUD|nr:hypothetical protein CF5_0131 [Staphylococcus phage CF5]
MTKNNNPGISEKNMQEWLEAITQGTVEGKEIDEKMAKKLERLGNKQVTLNEATRIAKVLTQVNAQEMASAFDTAFNSIDLLMIVMQDELGITEEQVEKAQGKLKEKREEYLKEKQKELEEKQKEASKKEDTESDSNEKVVQMSKRD